MTVATDTRPTVRILGCHGVPAAYGGFETAAEHIGLHLVKRGWRVIVYCQLKGEGPITEDTWRGIERVNIPMPLEGWRGTAKFDWISIQHASQFRDVCLTLGYNTGVYNYRQWLKRIPNVINMDGIEWKRARWGFMKQAILYVNERFAAFFGDRLIADHPEIKKYLLTRAPDRKITTITYGADRVDDAPTVPVTELGLEPGRYVTLVARSIPENSILEIVQGFSRRPRGYKLVIVGGYAVETDSYHRQVKEAAGPEVVFPGAIYDQDVLRALRFHGAGYMHGHTVGGTNPSLVEAMAAGNPVIAHDNLYNRWVAQNGALYFTTADDVDACVSKLLTDAETRAGLQAAVRQRHAEEFTWEHITDLYEAVLASYQPAGVKPNT